jgi:hypothetical protein
VPVRLPAYWGWLLRRLDSVAQCRPAQRRFLGHRVRALEGRGHHHPAPQSWGLGVPGDRVSLVPPPRGSVGLDHLSRGALYRPTRSSSSGGRARSTRTASGITSSALSRIKIPSKRRLSGSRRCTRLGSRSSPGSEQRRRANRSPVYGARRCVGQLAVPTLSEPLSRFAPQRAHSSYFWPSSFHFQRIHSFASA